MPKNIVLFSDGTGNSASKLFKSNVWRTYQLMDLSATDQIAFYDDGVGTSSFKPMALIGGAFGWGLKRNVIDLYTFLCRNYQEGDRIYCFGFSRGAFTVRFLTGVVITQGLVKADNESHLRKLAREAFRRFRRQHFSSVLKLEVPARAIRDIFSPPKEFKPAYQPNIHFLGVWDTVAAYGLPIDELTRAWNWVFPLTIPDREPNLSRVDRICHAVALDDERNTFHPVLFNEKNLPQSHFDARNISDEKLTQVWFAGMHSNVGGGYPDDALSQVALVWMMEQAEKMDLRLKPGALDSARSQMDVRGKLYDSRRGLGGLYRYQPRRMELLVNDIADPKNQVVIQKPKIHHSVAERIKSGVDRYAPIVLPSKYAVVSSTGEIQDSNLELEEPEQAQQRQHLQENIWNLVWYKRVAYFLSIAAFGLMLIFPVLLPSTQVCETHTCLLSIPIGWAGAFLPKLADPWLTAYESHPASFLGLLAIFGVLLRVGSAIQGKVNDRMGDLWSHAGQPGAQVKQLPEPSWFPYRLRTSGVYQFFFRLMKKVVLPLAAGLLALSAILQTGSRILFQAAVSTGVICSDASDAVKTPHRTLDFEIGTVCQATQFDAVRGKTYRLTMTVDPKNRWYDKEPSIEATVEGVKAPTRLMSLFVLLRREVKLPWLKPMARIGGSGTDDYPLDQVEEVPPDPAKLTAEFTARRNGRVYIFVNDAVLPVPDRWQYFYKNNHGKATVEIGEARTWVIPTALPSGASTQTTSLLPPR